MTRETWQLLTGIALICLGAGVVVGYLLARLSFPAREVAEPTARRTPHRVENGAAAGRPPGDGGNPGVAHSRTDAAAPGTARYAPRHEAPARAYVRAGHPVQRPHLDSDPFTGETPALTDELLNQLTAGNYLSNCIARHGMERGMRMAMPVLGRSFPAQPALTGARGGCSGDTVPSGFPALELIA